MKNITKSRALYFYIFPMAYNKVGGIIKSEFNDTNCNLDCSMRSFWTCILCHIQQLSNIFQFNAIICNLCDCKLENRSMKTAVSG